MVFPEQQQIPFRLQSSEPLTSNHRLRWIQLSWRAIPLPLTFYGNSSTSSTAWHLHQCCNHCSIWKQVCHTMSWAAWLKQFNSTELVSDVWKLPTEKSKREAHPECSRLAVLTSATHPVNVAFSGRQITVSSGEICKAGWAVSLSMWNRVPGTNQYKETPVQGGYQH